MVVTLFPLLIGGAAFAFAIYGRQRFALGVILAGPMLLLALCAAIWVRAQLNPCPPSHVTCNYGEGLAIPYALFGGLAWVGVTTFGWFLGWSARGIWQASKRNADTAR